VQRTDLSAGARPAVTRLESGAIRLDAAVTRVGVLQYSDGETTWGELKLPEEVFSPDSLATLPGVAVTVGHPAELVTPDTWAAVAKGHVADGVRPERGTGLVVAPVVVADGATIAAVERGDLLEVSAGYTCDLEASEGVYDGVRYRAVQRAIRYNHAALGPQGWGRAGADVRLRLNGAAVEVSHQEAPMPKDPKDKPMMDAPPEAAPAPAPASPEAMRIAALEAALADAMRSNAELKAQLQAMQPAAPEVEVELEDSLPPAVQDSIAVKRLRLLAGVRAVCGDETRTDGVSSADLRRAVVVKAFPSVKLDGLDAKAVAALADAALDAASTSSRSHALASAHPGAPRADSLSDLDPADALRRRTSSAWTARRDH
jgi:hypothetical protein